MASILDKETEVKARKLLLDHGSGNKEFQLLMESLKTKAIEFVRKHADVITLLKGKKVEFLSAELRAERDELVNLLPTRVANVGIYDYSRDEVIIQEVDLRTATLLKRRVMKGLQPPLSKNELAEAKLIASRHPAYSQVCKLPGVQLSAFPAQVGMLKGHAAKGHRVFTIYFYPAGSRKAKVAEAVVDLSTGKLLGEMDLDVAVVKKLYLK